MDKEGPSLSNHPVDKGIKKAVTKAMLHLKDNCKANISDVSILY